MERLSFKPARHPGRRLSSAWPLALCLAGLLFFGNAMRAIEALAQTGGTISANRQFAAAVRLQNLESYDLAATAWEGFLRDYPDDERAGKAYYNLGVCAYQQDDLPRALSAFQNVVRRYPDFESSDAATLYQGLTQYALARRGDRGKYTEAGHTFKAFLGKFPESPYMPEARYYYIEAGYMTGQKAWAAAQYQEWLSDYPKSPLRPDALYAAGVALEETGEPVEAGKAYDTFLRENPDHELAAEVELRRGETLFQVGDYQQALARFDTVLKNQASPLADLATLRKAESLARLDRLGPAADLYASIPGAFPQSQYANQAKLAAGKCYYLAQDFASARKWLTEAYRAGGTTQAESLHLIAQCLLREGKPEDAATFVAGVLSRVENDAEKTAVLRLDQAEAYYAVESRRPEAERLYALIADRYPDHAVAPQALYMAGYAALERGDYEAAGRHAERFLERFEKSDYLADVLHVAAESAMQRNEPAAAERYYARAIGAKPDSPNAELWKVRRAVALSLQEKPDDVIRLLDEEASGISDTALAAETQFLLGESFLQKENYRDAATWLERSLKTQSTWRRADEARFALAEAHRGLGDTRRQQAALTALLRNAPKSPLADRAQYRLAESYHASGDLKSAADGYQKVADQYPESPSAPDALYELSCIYLEQNNMKAADATLSSLVADHPQHALAARARYIRGRARHQLEDFKGAADDLQASISKLVSKKDKADARYLLGLCQLGLERNEEAAATLARLLKDSPDYPGAEDAQYQMAWALKLAGREDQSLTAFQALARSESTGPLAAEARYRVGEDAYAQERYAEAARWFEKASHDGEDETLIRNALHKLGWTRYQQDDLDAAIDAFERQLSLYPGGGAVEADARFMLGECHFRKEAFSEAYAAYEQLALGELSNKAYKAIALLHAGQSAADDENWKQSARWLAQLQQECPESNEATPGLYELAWARQNLGETEEAIRLYEQVIGKTTAEAAARAQFMIGEIQFQGREHADAITSYLAVLDGYNYPTWQANAAYEAARCFEVLKQPAQAVKLYKELIQRFPESEKAPLAKSRLEELGG